MRKHSLAVNSIRVLSILLVIMALTHIPQVSAEKRNKSSSDNQSAISSIEPQYVCMLNNQAYNKEQIPIEIEGKTYYGCCSMCEGQLRADLSSRSAIDPVSGNKVDKATSVIGSDPDGKVYYFENQENMRQFKYDKKP